MNYSGYITEIADLMALGTTITNPAIAAPSTDDNFNDIISGMIDYAEQRIYRELNLLATVVRDSTTNLTANTRSFTLPSSLGRFVAVQGINVITPVGSGTTTGTRNPLVHHTREFLDFYAPEQVVAHALPKAYAMVTDQVIIVGPSPDAAYTVEVIGTIRPTPLSASNATTTLTLYLPDLFIAASMIFASAYQKNFGAQSADPAQAQSWENQYKTLFASADAEEMRKRFNRAINGANT